MFTIYFREQFLKDGRPYKAGETIKMEKLGETLQRIAEGGANAFYNGTLADDIVADIKEAGTDFHIVHRTNTPKGTHS